MRERGSLWDFNGSSASLWKYAHSCSISDSTIGGYGSLSNVTRLVFDALGRAVFRRAALESVEARD